MGFTGKKAAQFKEAYINAFNEMEQSLKQPIPSLHSSSRVLLYMSGSVVYSSRPLLDNEIIMTWESFKEMATKGGYLVIHKDDFLTKLLSSVEGYATQLEENEKIAPSCMKICVADYLANTMHLTAEEHGVYLLLMLNYWQTGKPIPKSRLAKIARVSKYEYHPPEGGCIIVCPLDAPLALIWDGYNKIINNQNPQYLDIKKLINEFFLSVDFAQLAEETRKDYIRNSKKLLPVFGNMHPDNIKPQHIRQYMDKRGMRSKTQANREKSFFSRVYRWAYEHGKVQKNPCQGVRQFKEMARERYVTDAEYEALYSVAPSVVQVAMEIAYLCCARQKNVLSLERQQIQETGVYIRQGKTGVKQIKAWSDRLKAAIELANRLHDDNINSLYVLHKKDGQRYQRDGFNSRWRKVKKLAATQFPELDFNFTFHDLKAKGISDLEGTLYEKQAISGHKNISQTARYDRKVTIVPVVGGQKK